MLKQPKSPYIGAAYYPECWEENLIDEDIAKMKEAGINCVRVAEFAWSSMEPQEGKFVFDWLHRVLDKLNAAKIAVILCTPSATPPKWLTDKYEETLQMYSNGKRAQFGGRCHICKTSPVMREKNRIIVTKMCEEFRDHPAVIGWQIDNEFFPYQEGCFCLKCQAKFSEWLKAKYKTVENLNESWGGNRWSQNYSSFENIIPPREDTWNHPSLQTDWLRFSSDNIIKYCNEQAEIIHRYFDVPVGTDMMPMIGVDHYKMNEKLDVVQFNHYEQEGELERASFWFDFIRPIKQKPFWVTETQAGWVGNKEAAFGYRAKGNCYVNTWLPVAKGGEMNAYWHWRSHYAGHELHHGSILTTSGRFNHIISEIQQVSEEFEKCAELIKRTKVRSEIAIMMSATSAFNLQYAPIIHALDYPKILYEQYHRPLRNFNVDVIDTPHTLDGYKVLISPFLTHCDENGFKQRVLEWVKTGGKWIVGPMTDIYTDYAAKYRKAPFGFLEDVAGVKLKYQVPLGDERFKAVWTDGTPLFVSEYYDGFELNGAQGLARYTSESLDGLYAIAEMPYGKGSIVTVGSVIDPSSLLRLVGMEASVAASSNVEVIHRSGDTEATVCIELENREGEIELKKQYTDILTGNILTGKVSIKPYQVLVLTASGKCGV